MSLRKPITLPFLLLIGLMQASCSSVQHQEQLESASASSGTYCDSFMVYDMCAADIDHSGEVDVLYFQDTEEVFMINPGSDKSLWASMPDHQCIQTMDEEMQSASKNLLTITAETGALTKAKMKARLMLSYAKYMPKVNRCKNNGVELAAEDTFGDESFADLDFDGP